MKFEPDDLDWAVGELLHIQSIADKLGMPHTGTIDPPTSRGAWAVVNRQPLAVKLRCAEILGLYKPNPAHHEGENALDDTP